MWLFDVGADNKLSNGKLFSDFMVTSVKCEPDGVHTDVNSNLWCSSDASRSVGFSGVTMWNPQGKLIGRHPKSSRNLRQHSVLAAQSTISLFMAASQSLYAVYTGTQGTHPG